MILGRMLRPKLRLFRSRAQALPEPDLSITGRLTGNQKSGKDAAAGRYTHPQDVASRSRWGSPRS
jgi:hypothetical protein